MQFDKHKNIFAGMSNVHNTISLSCHKQVCLIRPRFGRYFSHHWGTYVYPHVVVVVLYQTLHEKWESIIALDSKNY